MARCAVTIRLRLLLLIGSICLLAAPNAYAWSYNSFACGYSISIPDDWVQVPEETLAAKAIDLPTTGHPASKIDVAFQPKRSASTLDYPYILVEVLRYSEMGIPQQVDDREINQIVQKTTGLDPANPFTEDTQVVEGGGEVEPLDGVLNFDNKSRRFTCSTAGRQANLGLTRTRQWGFFGKDAMVLVTLHEKGRGSDRLRDMARAVAGSFKFEIGREYQPAFTLSDALAMTRQLVDAPNLGMVVTLVCVFTGVLFAVIALIANRRTHMYQQYNVYNRER